MDPMRFAPRPMSPSSMNTRSNFESRTKSPLSISSSIYEDSIVSSDEASSLKSTRTSSDASINSYDGRPDSTPTQTRPASKVLSTVSQTAYEGMPPLHSRYGAGGKGRQQTQMPLMTPQRLSVGQYTQMRPAVYSTRYTPLPPGEGFRRLPEELLLVILGELKKSHLHTWSLSCSTCWMRELLSLGLSCKKWWAAASHMLYEDIRLVGSDSLVQTKKKYKIKYGTRLKLLRRTLRARPDFAQHVKSLKLPSIPEAAKTKKEQEDYVDMVASVIMACPNLERLPGFYPTYQHQFSRFTHAISTRTKLKETVWVIGPSLFKRQHRYDLSNDASFITPVISHSPVSLLPEQCIDFLTYHANWPNLQTLFLHCNPGGTLDSLLFEDVFHSLPSLAHLHISDFPIDSFNDTTLLFLPPLKSLRLENLPGVTNDGLSSFASPRRTNTLKSLSLISLSLTSLPVLARMFSHLKSLTHFTISQGPSISLPIGEVIFLHPYLASFTLEYLHWEFTNPDDEVATGIMAKAMAFGGFPSLRTIRAPTDFDGTLQMFCRPRDRIELPGDRYRNLGTPHHPGIPQSQSLPNLPSPTKATFAGGPIMPSPTRSTFSMGHASNGSVSSISMKPPGQTNFTSHQDEKWRNSEEGPYQHKSMSLATSRRMAQHRIESAPPQFHIIIWDENNDFVERYEVGAFIGQVHSKVHYSLKPDAEGTDEGVINFGGAGGLMDGTVETTLRDGCTGSWILDAGLVKGNNGRGKGGWWHTERGRWRPLPLEKFFQP